MKYVTIGCRWVFDEYMSVVAINNFHQELYVSGYINNEFHNEFDNTV